MIVRWIIVVCFVVFGLNGCGEGEKEEATKDDQSSDKDTPDESGTISIATEVPANITEVSLGSLPTINEAGIANPGTLQVSALTTTNLIQLTEDSSPVVGEPVNRKNLQDIFALECYWDLEKDNWCPDAITEGLQNGTIPVYTGPNSSGDAPYWFSNFSILGIIHHAEAYFNGSYSRGADAKKIKPGTIRYKVTQDFQGKEVSEGNGGKYIIEIPNLYNRYYEGKGEDRGMHFLFNGDAKKDGRYSAIPWAKFLDSDNSTRNTGGAQSYLTLKEGTDEPHFYAVNQVMSYSQNEGEGFRMVLLINYDTNHFLYTSASTNSMGTYATIVGGKGGFDSSTSSWKEGAYYAQDFYNGAVSWEACVDNKTQVVLGLDDEHEKCQFVASFFGEGSSFDPADFLSLTEVEKKDMTNFLKFFVSATPISDQEIPGGSEDFASFPDSIEFEEVEATSDSN